jgi:ABC-type uncharacterized transport system fused permease/ATPase subunit
MTVVEQHLEGNYRYVNSRLIVNSEEIAFYQVLDSTLSFFSFYFSRAMRGNVFR